MATEPLIPEFGNDKEIEAAMLALEQDIEAEGIGGDESLEDEGYIGGEEEPGITFEELQSLVRTEVQDAIDFCEEELAQDRVRRQAAYDGEGYDEDALLDDTRSRVMSRDVSDTVHQVLPSMMRIFCGGGPAVEYLPVGFEDVPFASQATCYVNDIVLGVDNIFYNVFYSAAHDALVKGLGVFKWWWTTDTIVEGSYYTGLDNNAFQLLAADPDVEVTEYEEYKDLMSGLVLINCSITRRVDRNGKMKVEAVPPEERLINRRARSMEDCTLYGHRRDMSVSELVAMGFSYEQVVAMGGNSDMDTNEEAVERLDGETYTSSTTSDPSMKELEVCEIYLNVDLDGDGIAERYRIYCGGNNYQILEWDDGDLAVDLCEDIPFSEICPDPVPHRATGKALSDKVIDVQRVKTNLLRGTLDSLSRSIFPQLEVVENAVNIDDAMNPEIGAIIRTRAPGMIREIVTSFMGKECLPVLAYMDEVKADRTGVSDATMGLNPQSLQSSTEGAVTNTISAAQTQIEMISRHFCNGITQMFKGVLRTIKQHQDQARTVRLRNTWVEVDPSQWNAGMDASPKVALGRGTEQDRMQYLMMIAQKQEMAIEKMGPANGICTLAEYRNTLEEMVRVSGYYHAETFFLPTEMGQQVQQLADQNKELQGQNAELTQQSQFMQAELMKRSASAANKDDAAAEKSRAGAFKDAVSGLHEAGTAVVEGSQVMDELALTNVVTMKPQNQQGPQQ